MHELYKRQTLTSYLHFWQTQRYNVTLLLSPLALMGYLSLVLAITMTPKTSIRLVVINCRSMSMKVPEPLYTK